MKKRLLSLLLTIAMLVTMLPMVTIPAAAASYDYEINLNELLKAEITGNGFEVDSYGTLILTGAENSRYRIYGDAGGRISGVATRVAMDITLDNVTLRRSKTNDGPYQGLLSYCSEAAATAGNGRLTLVGNNYIVGYQGNEIAIDAMCNLTIGGTGILISDRGGTNAAEQGIKCNGNLTIEGGRYSLRYGNKGAGIVTKGGAHTMVIKNCVIDVQASEGIFAEDGTLEIENAVIDADCGSTGIFAKTAITINNSTVNAAAQRSYAIGTPTENIGNIRVGGKIVASTRYDGYGAAEVTGSSAWRTYLWVEITDGPSVKLGPQDTKLTAGSAGSSTYDMKVRGYMLPAPTLGEISLQWYADESGTMPTSAPAGITADLTSLTQVTVTTTDAAAIGSYYFKVTAVSSHTTPETATSAVVTVTVDKPPYPGPVEKTIILEPLVSGVNATLTVADFFPGGSVPPGAKLTEMSYVGDYYKLIASNGIKIDNGDIKYQVNANLPETNNQDEFNITIQSANYADITAKLYFKTVAATPVQIVDLVAATDLVYNGSPQAGYTGTAKVVLTSDATMDMTAQCPDLVYTYTSNDGGSYNATTPPTDVGEYKLVVSVPVSNTDYAGTSADILFTIAKKAAPTIANVTQGYFVGETGQKTIAAPNNLPTDAGTATYAIGAVTGDSALIVSPTINSTTGELSFTLANSATPATASVPVTVTMQNYETANYEVEIATNLVVRAISIDTPKPVTGAAIENGTNTPPAGATSPVVSWSKDQGATWTETGSFAVDTVYETKYVYTAAAGVQFASDLAKADVTVSGGEIKSVVVSTQTQPNDTLTVIVTWPATVAPPEYSWIVKVAGQDITDGGYWKNSGGTIAQTGNASDYNVYWDAATDTLHMNGLNTTAGASDWPNAAIYVYESTATDVSTKRDFNVEIVGTNKALNTTGEFGLHIGRYGGLDTIRFSGTGSFETSGNFAASYTPGNAEFSGAGSYTFRVNTPTSQDAGIQAGFVTVSDTATVNAQGGNYGMKISRGCSVAANATLIAKGSIAGIIADQRQTGLLSVPVQYSVDNGGTWNAGGVFELQTGMTEYNTETTFITTKKSAGGDLATHVWIKDFSIMLSSDATLSDLTVDQGALSPAFAPNVTDYTVNVGNDVSSLTISPTVNDTGKSAYTLEDDTGAVSENPLTLAVGDNVVKVVVTAQDGTELIYTITITRAAPSTGGGPSTPEAPKDSVIVDGKTENIGKTETTGDTTTVIVDPDKLGSSIGGATDGSSVVVQVDAKGDTAAAQFVVKNVEDMASKDMTLTVQAGKIRYELPTAAVDTKAITEALGQPDTSKIPFTVTVTTEKPVTIPGVEVIGNPVTYTVTAAYGGKTVTVDTFNRYVPRVYEITAEQARKITTAVVREANGAVRHIPTYVYEQNGKYYAVVNSRTNSTYVLIFNEQTFADTKGAWYEQVVAEMASRKIVNGVSADRFDGGRDITRAEFAAILVRALGLPAQGTAAFGDVASSAWYSGVVATAAQYGLVEGVGGNRFEPQRAITRQEAMAMVMRAAKLTPFTGKTVQNPGAAFTDYAAVSAWAKSAVDFNLANGLIVGDKGEIRPQDNITRGEVATVVLRLLQQSELVDVRSKT